MTDSNIWIYFDLNHSIVTHAADSFLWRSSGESAKYIPNTVQLELVLKTGVGNRSLELPPNIHPATAA